MADLFADIVALVTGSSAGIGQGTCLALARHGVRKLALLDIDPVGAAVTENKVLHEAKDVEIITITVDTADENSIVKGIQQVVDRFGRIDVAVNNAGIPGSLKPSTEISVDEFRNVMDINTIGLWISQREELRHMLRQDPRKQHWGPPSRGVIVNMSSTFGHIGPSSLTPATAYCTSILGITKADANCFAKDGIRINAICPGYVRTEAMKGIVEESDFMKQELAKVPMARFAEIEEIVEVICFLASHMSSYMSGSSIIVDGGYTAQ